MSYFDTLFNASYNGAPFAVTSADSEQGRRLVKHKYPFRDTIWAEDLGKRPDQFTIEGFLVGDDVIAQRDFMRQVARQTGPGILIHPSYGILNVTLDTLKFSESMEHGRVIKLTFEFTESGQKLFPSLLTSTFNSVLTSIGNLNSAASGDFLSQVGPAIANGAAVVTAGVQTVNQFTAIGGAVVKTATNLFHLSSALPGSFGRYNAGNTGSSSGSIIGGLASAGGIAAQLGSLISFGAGARASVSSSASNVSSVAGQM